MISMSELLVLFGGELLSAVIIYFIALGSIFGANKIQKTRFGRVDFKRVSILALPIFILGLHVVFKLIIPSIMFVFYLGRVLFNV